MTGCASNTSWGRRETGGRCRHETARYCWPTPLQRSRSTFPRGSFLSFFVFQEGILGTAIHYVGVGQQYPSRYCWSFYFQATRLLSLRRILEVFRPSTQAHSKHNFRYLGVDQQYPSLL